MKTWAVIPVPFGAELPLGLRVVGVTHPTRADAEARANELADVGRDRWPLDLVVCEVRDDHIVSAYVPNPRRRWAPPAIKWARTSLSRIPHRTGRPEAVGALLAESELSRLQLSQLQRDAVGVDPVRSRAARRVAAVRRRVDDALRRQGADALAAPIAAAASEQAADRVRGGAPVGRAVAEVLDDARRLETEALSKGRVDPSRAAAALRRQADKAGPSRRALLEAAATVAAVAPEDACASPPGEAGHLDAAGRVGRVPVVFGAEGVVYVPSQAGGLRSHPSRYALIDAADIEISHDPWSFRPNRVYPPGLQERAYERDQAERLKVERAAQHFRAELVVNTNPDANSGPPIVGNPPWVLGGNSRAMVIRRVLQEGRAYTTALRDELGGCTSYGLSPDQVGTTTMLVRVLLGDYDPVSISRALNLGFTQVAGPAARAVSVGRVLPARLLELLAAELLDESATLATVMARRGGEILRLLRDADVITPQSAAQWQATRDGRLLPELSREGRQLLRDALLGRLVEDREALALSPPRLEDIYERAAPALLALEVIAQ